MFRSLTAELVQYQRDPDSAQWIADVSSWPDAWTGRDLGGRPDAFLVEAERDGDPQSIVNALEWLMDRAYTAQDFDAAVGYGTRLLEHGFGSVVSRATVGRVALHAGDFALARRVLALVEPGPGGIADADIGMLRAGIAAREGRTREALEAYRAALTGYRDYGARFDLALTGLDMAALIGADEPTVAAAASDARAIFLELDAKPLVDRLDRLMAAAPPAASVVNGTTAAQATTASA
jgi:hypothetical protein